MRMTGADAIASTPLTASVSGEVGKGERVGVGDVTTGGTTTAGTPIVTVYEATASGETPLEAVMSKSYVPGTVGWPEMVPVAASSASPGGSDPTDTEYVGAGVPEAVTVCE